MTPLADVASITSVAAWTPLIAMTVLTWTQDARRQPFTRRWRRVRRARRTCRTVAVPGYAATCLLYVFSGEMLFAVSWFASLGLATMCVVLNRKTERLRHQTTMARLRRHIADLDAWHATWNRWDTLNRPIGGATYDRVMTDPPNPLAVRSRKSKR